MPITPQKNPHQVDEDFFCGVIGSSDEPLISLLSFFERLKNDNRYSQKQMAGEINETIKDLSHNKLIEETKPKKRKGLRR